MQSCKVLYTIVILTLLTLTSGCIHFGQRALTFQIEQGEEVLFSGFRGVDDRMPVHKMWNEIGDVSFKPTGTAAEDAEAKTTTSLQGTVIVRIEHAGNEQAVSSIENLTLHAGQDEEISSWSINDSDVERIKLGAKN